MDFVVRLLWFNGCNAIWVVVDCLTQQQHLVPYTPTVDAKDLADFLIQWVFYLHGLLETITSNHGLQFASDFWGRLSEHLQIGCRMSTTFRLQTVGQIEMFNSVMDITPDTLAYTFNHRRSRR